MRESTPSFQEIASVQGRELLTTTAATETFIQARKNVLKPAIVPEDRTTFPASFFAPRWQDKDFADKTTSEQLEPRRRKIINLLTADQQERDSIQHTTVQGATKKAYASPPSKDNPNFSYGLVIENQDGTKEFIEGETTAGNLIFAYAVIEEQADDIQLKQEAGNALAFLRTHTNVEFSGVSAPISGIDFYNKHLLPNAVRVAGVDSKEEFNDLSLDKKLAALAKAEENLDPKYQLVCAKEPELEAAETVKTNEQAGTTLNLENTNTLAPVFNVVPGKEEEFNAFLNEAREEGMTNEQFLDELKQRGLQSDEAIDKLRALALARNLYKQVLQTDAKTDATLDSLLSDFLTFTNITADEFANANTPEKVKAMLEKGWKKSKEIGSKPELWLILYYLLMGTTSLLNSASQENRPS